MLIRVTSHDPVNISTETSRLLHKRWGKSFFRKRKLYFACLPSLAICSTSEFFLNLHIFWHASSQPLEIAAASPVPGDIWFNTHFLVKTIVRQIYFRFQMSTSTAKFLWAAQTWICICLRSFFHSSILLFHGPFLKSNHWNSFFSHKYEWRKDQPQMHRFHG